MATRSPFPHMLPHDVALFASFVMSESGRKYDAWDFDVHIGEGVATPGWPDNPTAFDVGRYLTQLRIDAIGWIGSEPTIFEVKPKARLSAIGQVQVYCWEFAQITHIPCKKAIITDYVNDQTIRNLLAFGIDWYTVPEATVGEIVLAQNYVSSLPTRFAELVRRPV